MPSISSVSARLGRGLLMAAALLGGSAFGADSPAAENVSAREVVGYAKADRTGAKRSWMLPPDAPFLLVPEVGPELDAVATVESGGEVGVALFQQPYFQSKDQGCTPDLGTDARPDLKWLGATSRFVPGVPGQIANQAQRPDPTAGGYTSLIIYDRDLGPPPGALLLDRRRTLGTACPNAIHKIFYNRLFVPIAPAPESIRCFDLAGLQPGAEGKEILMSFKASDRLALLTPADLDDGYAGQPHRFTVTLFDDIGCSGTPLGLKSGATISGVFRLDDYGFRDKARSLRIAYEGGVLSPYLAAPPPAPEIAAPQPQAKDEALAALESATTQPTAMEPAAAEPIRAEPETASAPVPLPVDSAVEPAVAEAAVTAVATTATAVTPAPTQPTAGETPVDTAQADQAAANLPANEPPESSQSQASQPASDETMTDQTAAVIPPTAAGSAQGGAGADSAPLDLPKLQPNLEPETRVAAAASQTFAYPVQDIYRLNFCLNWERDCGAPAADAWCRAQGFAKAADFAVDENIGSVFPTIVLGEKRICARFVCDGFAEITCVK